MPELPEVEVVRAGLAPAVTGALVRSVVVLDGRALKRHLPLGPGGVPVDDGAGGHGATMPDSARLVRSADLVTRLEGVTLGSPVRRGKFLWIPMAERETLLAHLGMSGQLLLRSADAPEDRHVRVRFIIEHPVAGTLRLDFADQRLFGSLAIDRLVPTPDGAAGGCSGPRMLRGASAEPYSGPALMPAQAKHIARDVLDPAFDRAAFVRAVRARASGVKALLLNQTLMSGVGNIYADEALWRARVHPDTPGRRIGAARLELLLSSLCDVLTQALSEGGTSFDEQYVNVNGQAGYFAHSLNAYGRTGSPCARCGTPIRRVPFGGRSSHVCPACQRRR